MRLGIGIFLGYLLIALLAGFFVLKVFVDEIKPSARQSMEDSLVDAANLLAELAVDDLKAKRLQAGPFSKHVEAYKSRTLNASIWGHERTSPGFRIYITDALGIVQYDSTHADFGKDFSRWNDVYLTLKGAYGVRSSPASPARDDISTAMHVAAPIKEGSVILGVLTIVKSNSAVEPFIERTRNKIVGAGYWLLAASLVIGVVISLWLSASVQKLVSYSEAVTRGERATLPPLSLTEIQRLGHALESMRERLEGKRYVEDYIATLTHEMKSPLTAIQASSELLQEEMPENQRQKFLTSITDQTKRLHLLIDKMLQQATLENRQGLEVARHIDLADIIKHAAESIASKLHRKKLELMIDAPDRALVRGDPFLMEQALLNLLENAADFSPENGIIALSLTREVDGWMFKVRDQGAGVPPFATDRVFERYYSLPRPDNGPKSTGLGLAFVRQVMLLHNGRAELSNHPAGGAEARLYLPT